MPSKLAKEVSQFIVLKRQMKEKLRRCDMPPACHTSVKFVKSVTMGNDGHEEEQIYQLMTYQSSSPRNLNLKPKLLRQKTVTSTPCLAGVDEGHGCVSGCKNFLQDGQHHARPRFLDVAAHGGVQVHQPNVAALHQVNASSSELPNSPINSASPP